MAFDYMHPPEDFEYLGEWCKAWRDPATGDWTISQLFDGLDTAQIILSGEEVRELARLATQHDPTDYELEYGELRRPMFASPDENGTAPEPDELGTRIVRIWGLESIDCDGNLPQRHLPSSDIECTVYRNDRRVHVTIHADDSNRLGLYDTNGKALLANGKDE